MKLRALYAAIVSLGMGPAASAEMTTLLDDEFNNDNPATNNAAGHTVFNSDAIPAIETAGMVRWGSTASWDWASSELQSNDEYPPPAAGESYRVEWAIGPMKVSALSDQTWGDIRMELSLTSARLPQGSGPAEMWPNTTGTITAQVTVKESHLAAPTNESRIQFWAKDDAIGANANGAYLFGVVVDSTIPHTVALTLGENEITCTVDGAPLGSAPLVNAGSTPPYDLGWGVFEEFENGWYPVTRAAMINAGRGTMSVDRLTVTHDSGTNPSAPPEITSLRATGGNLNLEWSDDVVGGTYTVQRSTNLTAWNDLTSGLPGMSFTDPTPPAGSVFYRIVRE
jgi:hypothetical protein